MVEPYRVAPSIELEENSNFCVFDDSLVDVDAEGLNFVLSSSRQANVDEENDIHIEDCDEGDDNSIDDEEEENSDGCSPLAFHSEFKNNYLKCHNHRHQYRRI